jgi:hypothetical protein
MGRKEEAELIKQDRAYWRRKKQESRARQRGESLVESSIADTSAVVVSIFLCGHGVVPTKNRAEANIISLNREGKEIGYQKYISNLYGYEIRSRTRKTGACHAMLYSGQIETKLDELPIVPPAAIYAARAFEWHEVNKAAA